MTANVVLIGKMADYQANFNAIHSKIQKDVLKVIGVVLEKSNYKTIDDIPVYSSLSDVKKLEFDYFILLTENQEYYKVLADENKFEQKIIPVRVFNLPYFNFTKYQQLLENPPSIISRHCWGGKVYHSLGLPFNSPFVNLFLNDVDFNKLAKNFKHYMNQEVTFLQEGFDPILESNYPIGKLDDITIYFNHYSTFEEAKSKWDQRKERINYDNLFFETTTEYKSVALEFNSLDLPHKLCFCVDDIEGPDIINCIDMISNFSTGQLGMFVNGTSSGEIPYFDLIELLLHYNHDSRMDVYKKSNYERTYNFYKTTQLFNLEYNRFFGLDDELPWNLEETKESFDFVENLNISHPKIYYELNDITELKKINEKDLPDIFYLKKSNQSSGTAMLLKKLEESKYLDYISSKELTIDEIVEENGSNKINEINSRYLLEEVIDNFVEDMAIPLEYRVYSFNGIPKIILQIDRNSECPNVFVFDGNFIPLKEGRDWFFNKEIAQMRIPIIPPSAYRIISQSIELANAIDNRYVVTTWFDNGKEAVFGGLSFATKEIFEGKITFSREILLNLEKSLNQVLYADFIEKGYRIDAQKLHDALDNELNYVSEEYYDLLKGCLSNKKDSFSDMTLYFEKTFRNEVDISKKRLIQHLEIAWLEVSLLYDKLFTEKICRQVNAGWGFVFLKTYYFQQRINESKEMLQEKSKLSDWYKIRWAQFIFDMGGNEDEKTKAKNYVNTFSKQGMKYAINVKEKYGL